MSTDYQILMQKFNNFKKFITSICKNEEVLKEYETMSENTFLLFGLGFLLPNKDKLSFVAERVCEKIGCPENDDHKKKIVRYFECFCEYLEQLNNKETAEKIIVQTLQEKGISPEDFKECEKTGSIQSIEEKLYK